MKSPILIEPLDADLRLAIRAASLQDGGHCAPLATHAFTRGGDVVGAAALCAPTITFWAHSKKLHPRESLDLLQRCQVEASKNHSNFLGLCSADSPFRPLLARFGWRLLGTADVFDFPPPPS